ncbi:hypothetical protein DRE_06581 [Drechslerella stenobrocha 248]|uniref:BTB domain-containing protein n=1 Tax=Drechslerella stenobrocha 248 TaxID=1043628 RepID=W7I6Y2_9PEZI|nr:hypothetical protein DRE_06581 [Drechslerella stenobrocha 248]
MSFSKLLKNNKYSDLKLIVGSEGHEFSVHRNIVCTWSGYIDRECSAHLDANKRSRTKAPKPFQFGASVNNATAVPDILSVHLPQIEQATMEVIIQYMYGQAYEILRKGNKTNMDIYVAAHNLEIPDLQRHILVEYTRVFKEKQGTWSHADILGIIATIIDKEFGQLDGFTEFTQSKQCQPVVMDMLNALINFIDLQVLLASEEFQHLLSDPTVAKILVIALLNRKWECKTCKTDKLLGSHTNICCRKCGEALDQKGEFAKPERKD